MSSTVPPVGGRSEADPAARLRWVALLFAALGLLLQIWRQQSLTASYDQGIFLQALWSGLHGHPFESTLSSQLSSAVVHDGLVPALGYRRLGQHFTPLLALWTPLVGLLGTWALPLLQVGLLTAAGLVLHRLALCRLEPRLAAMVAISWYGAGAVVGPLLGNFTDLCQLPLAVFALLLGLERRRPWLILLAALAVPLIREDTGVVLVGVGLWLAVRQRQRWPLALALLLWGAGWVVLVTSVLQPLFSEDSSRRFMVENFGQFITGRTQASSLEVLLAVLRQPWVVLRELLDPPGQTIGYLLAQGLPLLLLPLISLDAWLLMGLPLLGLLLARGKPSPLSIQVRYALLVAPGLFAGAVYWWQRHGALFGSRRLRALWAGAVLLSLLLTLGANPHRSLSLLIPDSVSPWIHRSPLAMAHHGQQARQLLAAIPPDAPVAATTSLVPLLAQRPVLTRFPADSSFRDRGGVVRPVDWIALDLEAPARFAPVSRGDRRELRKLLAFLASPQVLPPARAAASSPSATGGAASTTAAAPPTYGVLDVREELVLLRRGVPSDPRAWEALQSLRERFSGTT
ncbi:MAG: DUF2079 domain-containing protein [Synechococcaceae cyanobacterium]|nr:DUF2079 domain-containing protein [Synechococcaceae cyanobacterium]